MKNYDVQSYTRYIGVTQAGFWTFFHSRAKWILNSRQSWNFCNLLLLQAAIDNPIDSGGVEYYYQVDPSVTTLALQNIADPMQGQNMDRYKDPTGVALEETQTEKNQGEQIRYINNTSTVGP